MHAASDRARSASTAKQRLNAAACLQEMYVADVDLTRDSRSYGSNRRESRMRVPAFDRVRTREVSSNGTGLARRGDNGGGDAALVRSNESLKEELIALKSDLADSTEREEGLQLQVENKDRALQATKGDLIDTRMDLQRMEERLTVCAALRSLGTLTSSSRVCLFAIQAVGPSSLNR